MAATRVHINPDILTWAKERGIQRDNSIIEERGIQFAMWQRFPNVELVPFSE